MNPARSMGAILAAYGFDFGATSPALFQEAWISTGVYFAGDLLGGFLAGVVYRKIARNSKYGVSWKVVQNCVNPETDEDDDVKHDNNNNNSINEDPRGTA